MRHIRNLSVIILLAILATGCAVPMRGGGRLYILGGPQVVVVTNNMKMQGDLYENGGYLATLAIGDTYNVELGYSLNSNKILQFKAFTFGPNGAKLYQGQTSQAFYVQPGSNYNQAWVISYIEPVR